MAQLQSTNIYGTMKIHALTQSSASTSGALVISGGVGIGKNLYVGGNLNVSGSTSITGDFTAKSFNGLTITATTGTIEVPAGATMTFPSTNGIVITDKTAQSITGAKTFNSSTLKIKSTGTGSAVIVNSNNIASDYNISLPGIADTLVGRNTTDTLANKILTTPTINTATLSTPKMVSGTSINDTNGNELIKFPSTVASAINEITISNAATNNKPSIKATGDNPDISLELSGKGNGKIYASSDIEFNKNSNKNISVESTSSDIGKTLTISSGDSIGGTNIAGGDLIIQSGTGTGTAVSKIVFRTPTVGASGTTPNVLENRVVIDKDGISYGVWRATPIATDKGGTGLKSYATGDIIYSSAVNTLSNLTIGDSGKVLRSTGDIPSWSTLTIPDTVAKGSVLVTKTANTLTAESSTSGLKVLQNNAGTITWNDTTGTGATVYSKSPSISESITTISTSFDLLNTKATTVNAFGAATTLNIASSPDTASTYNLFNGAIKSGLTKNINIGTGGVSGSITKITLGSVASEGTNSTTINSDVSITGDTVIGGNLTVNGDITIKGGSTIIETGILSVEDINIELGRGNEKDESAIGGGITLHGSSDKTITWYTTGWSFNDNINISGSGSVFKIADRTVLSSNTLGSEVVYSSLTTLGNVKILTVVPNSENTDSDRIVISPSAVGLDSRSITIKTPTTPLDANRTYTLPNVGADADFVMTKGDQTINGIKTFGGGLSGVINKVTITAPTTSATLTIANGKTLTSNSSISLNGTDGKSITTYSSLVVGDGDITNNGNITIKSNDTGARTLTLNGNTTLVAGTMVHTGRKVAGKELTSDVDLNDLSAGAGLKWSSGTTYDGSKDSTLSVDSKLVNETTSIFGTLTTGNLTIANSLTNGVVNIANGNASLAGNNTAVNILSGANTGTASNIRTLNLGANGGSGTITNINIGTNITSASTTNKVSIGTINKTELEINTKSFIIKSKNGLDINDGVFKINDNVVIDPSDATVSFKKNFTSQTGSVTINGDANSGSILTLPPNTTKITGINANRLMITNGSSEITTLTAGSENNFLRAGTNGVPYWFDVNPFVSVRRATEIIATAGQTVFALQNGYSSSTFLDVFLNGVLLSPSDYDAIESPNISLLIPAKAGDIVRIVGYDNNTSMTSLSITGADTIDVAADNDTNAERYLIFCPNITGVSKPYSDTAITYNPNKNTLTAGRFVSTVATGTAPLTVASKTLVTNLNADYIDDYNASISSAANTVVVRNPDKAINVGGLNATTGYFSSATNSTSVSTGAVTIAGGLGVGGNIYGNKVYGAVWNDIADFVEIDSDTEVEFGKAYFRNEDGKIQKTNKKVSSIGIASDTFGFGVGQDENKKQMPVAVGGWVLAFTKDIYKSGTAMVASKNGILKKASILDKILFPERIIAIFDRVEKEEIWNGVEVKGRHWVKVK